MLYLLRNYQNEVTRRVLELSKVKTWERILLIGCTKQTSLSALQSDLYQFNCSIELERVTEHALKVRIKIMWQFKRLFEQLQSHMKHNVKHQATLSTFSKTTLEYKKHQGESRDTKKALAYRM